MATSLTSPGLVFAANKALLAAHGAIAKVKQFATDFSADSARPGETLAVMVYDTAAATPYDDTTNNYGHENGTLKGVKITFDNHVKKTYAFSPLDKLAVGASVLGQKGDAAGIAIARAIEKTVAALVNKTNIPKSAANESVLSTITKANLAKLRAVADSAGADPAGSVLALSPAAFAEALALFDANVYGGVEAVRDGVIPGLYGFKAVIQLPLSTDSAEKLVGAIIPAEALVVAGRTIPADDVGNAGEYGFTTDEDSGLSLDSYAYVDGATRKNFFTLEGLFGAKIVQPGACVRLVSAATA